MNSSCKFNNHMSVAILEAQKAFDMGEVPVGAVIVNRNTNEIIAARHNLSETLSNPLMHAEMLVIQDAITFLGSKYLTFCDIYVTLEPCAMCAAAISLTRVYSLYYGANDAKFGAVLSGTQFFTQKNCFHRPEIYPDIQSAISSELMKEFFKQRRCSSISLK